MSPNLNAESVLMIPKAALSYYLMLGKLLFCKLDVPKIGIFYIKFNWKFQLFPHTELHVYLPNV